ncbi:MAG: phosphatidylserine decarboxylase [Gammaproteobacteria bacterium]|nr:phosphatidylserine decarboxylase [Gammaproteobacteria bacterium]MBV9620469.1 phosphatidylserine decarboxylase [Gammaproteobacteria bacterium]
MTGPDSASARAFVALQYLLPQHALTALVHRLARVRTPLVKNALIDAFVRHYRPDLSEAQEPEARRYETFNDFFTRALRDSARPIDAEPDAVVSPVDGSVSQLGRLDGACLLQAKGHAFTLDALLDAEPQWCSRFRDGAFATLYLAPYNYHRVHMPLAGSLRAAWYVPGQLFSVNATTAASVPGLFARNERVALLFEDGPLSFVLVLVGALFVGSISTLWHGVVTPRTVRRRASLPVPPAQTLAKGAEVGRFNMGSTVILLLPAGSVEWVASLGAGAEVRVGRCIGHRP